MKALVAALLLAATAAYAGDKNLRWKRLDVTAYLDADGRMHVQERQSIVFNGDWNGGERTFRSSLENEIRLNEIARIESGKSIPLHSDQKLRAVDTYTWANNNTLRWRSRLPSDPPFDNREITYVLDYVDSYILDPRGGSYVLDHNFGLPDLQWPIDEYSLVFSMDPVWQPSAPQHIVRTNLPRGQNETITATLRYAGAGAPRAVNMGTPAALRSLMLAGLIAALALFAMLFIRDQRAIGRFAPLLDPASIDRRWLEENVLKFPPEAVGAGWDNRTGSAEVAAVIARMVQEGKLASRVENKELILTLKRDRQTFSDYEQALVNSLFIDGDTTSTDKIKKHYAKIGFDPVAKIRKSVERQARAFGKQGNAPKADWKPTMLVAATGIIFLIVAGFLLPINILGSAVTAGAVFFFYIFGVFGALDYRRRVTNLRFASLAFVLPMALLTIVVLLTLVVPFHFGVVMYAGAVLIAVAAIRSLFNIARSRDAGDRLENRRRLAAAREYFVRELQRPNPSLDDAWFPYVLAFGLGANVDRWFRSFGGRTTNSQWGTASHGGASSGSSSSSTSSWTGGGGSFGGAGASGTWAVAAAGIASGVASPSSGGSGGGGGGGSSGGGGGGGW